MEYILVTGGLGYIGSHCVVELLNIKENVIVIDNLSNSNITTYNKIKEISNDDFILHTFNIQDKTKLDKIFIQYKISLVIHFAGYKSVNESLTNPLLYYDNNIISAINLLQIMEKHNCKNIIFSSSCTVYGKVKSPVHENMIINSENIITPYGKTKYMIEKILQDIYISNPNWNIVILRYFNPTGCHSSGKLGEECTGIPNNLYPYILKVMVKQYDELKIFGNNYNTRDGTCIRDFIHVTDLALGHIKSMDKIKENCGLKLYNLGTGNGTSVLELVNTFEKVNNIKIKHRFCERRDGDIDIIYANIDKAINELDWKPLKTLEDICRDGFNFMHNKN